MGDHDSVAVAAKSLLQQASQLAVPVVHIPKYDDGKGGYSYDDNDSSCT